MIVNQLACQYISTKFPYPYEVIMDGLEKGQIFLINGEGNEAESQALEKILLENDFYEKPESKKSK